MKYWRIAKATIADFIADSATSHAAAIAFYTLLSIAPVLVIVIAVAGLVFGQEAARGEIVGQLKGMMGDQAAEAIQAMLQSASSRKAGIWATVIGVGTLLVTASGVFSELQASLNAIWKAEPKHTGVSGLVRARLLSLGLVMTLGFLLLVSLVLSTALKAGQGYLSQLLPGADLLFQALAFVVSFLVTTFMFGAIYKVLPDKKIEWKDVMAGALATSFLFTLGKFGISLYIGSSTVASSYGASSALVIILLWLYYSSVIFLLGAEFTKVYAETHAVTRASWVARGKPALPRRRPTHTRIWPRSRTSSPASRRRTREAPPRPFASARPDWQRLAVGGRTRWLCQRYIRTPGRRWPACCAMA